MSKKKKPIFDDSFPSMDDTFSFIAGYTPCGVPYGTTWAEIGIDPSLPFEEKVKLYSSKPPSRVHLSPSFAEDLKKMLPMLDDIQVKLDVIGDLSDIPELRRTSEKVRDVMEEIAIWVDDDESEELPF